MPDRFRFDIIQKRYKTESLNMMRDVAMANKNYFLDSFKVRQGWGKDKWQEVNRRIPGTKEYMYPKKRDLRRRTRPILVGKGSLRRAVNSSIRLVTPNRVYFSVDLPYAAVHNEGLKMKNGRFMPRRRFMGMNEDTNKLTKTIIQNYVTRVFKRS